MFKISYLQMLLNKLLTLCVLSLSLYSIATHSQVITKCQDSDGKWHYGEQVNASCINPVNSIRQDGVAVAEPVVNQTAEEKLTKLEIEQLAFEMEILSNDKDILLRYSALNAIELEEKRKLNEVAGQLEILQSLIMKIKFEIAYYADKEQTDAAIKRNALRHKALSKYLEQQVHYTSKRGLIKDQYISTRTRFIAAATRQVDTQ